MRNFHPLVFKNKTLVLMLFCLSFFSFNVSAQCEIVSTNNVKTFFSGEVIGKEVTLNLKELGFEVETSSRDQRTISFTLNYRTLI